MASSPASLLRLWGAALVLFAMVPATNVAAEPDRRVSEIVASGIGKLFPAAGSPLHYDAWPTPLHDEPGAMLAAVISADGQLVVTGAGHPAMAR